MNNKPVTILPFLHGKVSFARQVRSLLLKTRFDCIAVDIPQMFESELHAVIEQMPLISMIFAHSPTSPVYYIPTDPCDAAIEGLRQGIQNSITTRCIGSNELKKLSSVGPYPDDYAAEIIGFDRFNSLCFMTTGKKMHNESSGTVESQLLAHHILELKTKYSRILALIHYRHYTQTIEYLKKESTYNVRFENQPSYPVYSKLIHPDHLYFSLGELPFITGKYEKERHDLFSEPFNLLETVKDLFRETRDDYFDDKEDTRMLSPSRIQSALTFLRNLTIMSGQLVPSLPDIIDAAKGVGGNAFAVRILKSAKYYPYISMESDTVQVGIDRIKLSRTDTPLEAVNLFRDTELHWRTISIKPDPSLLQKRKYRYSWNPFGMCSHIPEDIRIERFNAYVRKKSLKILVEDYVKTEKFSTSVKDGIDIRETLRNWNTGSIFVKEIPPSRGNVDSVVIIFDSAHDTNYTHHTTWYAEHQNESTLSFFATDPFEQMVGPGIAKCYYGGLSLLFPPRHIPDIFQLTEKMNLPDLTSKLTYGAMLFSKEKVIPFISPDKPGTMLRSLASQLKKHLLWIPINTFSSETITKIRRFHILNGKIIRSWAPRFIED